MAFLGLERGALRMKISKAKRNRAKKARYRSNSFKGDLSLPDIVSGAKWSYKTITVHGGVELQRKLNILGTEGWELVSVMPEKGSFFKCILKKHG